MNQCINDVLEQYYNDYFTASFITTDELDELYELFAIIFADNNPDDIKVGLNNLLNHVRISDKTEIKDEKLAALRLRELKGDQRSSLWLNERMKYITASVSATCAGLTGKLARENQLLEKASMGKYRPFIGGYYTDMGNIFEPVTNSYYCFLNNTHIHDFGLIPNDTAPYEFLAASTDGVTTELINIEIKTLVGRFPDGKVKKQYYHQMQHQMECLGLNKSDFIEVRYDQHRDLESLRGKECCGIIIELYNIKNKCYEYEYSIPVNPDLELLKQWQNTRENIIKNYTDSVFIRWIYWTQNVYSCIKVDRDPKWITTMGPLLMEFYQELQELKNNPSLLNKRITDNKKQELDFMTVCLI